MRLREVRDRATLLEVTRGHPLVRWEVADDLFHAGYAVGSAVAYPRRLPRDRLALNAFGPADDLDALLAGIAALETWPPWTSVGVPSDALHLALRHLPLLEGNDWEWMWTTTAPPLLSGESQVVPLGQEDEPAIRSLLELANPRTHAHPFEVPGQVWVGIRHGLSTLVGIGMAEPNLRGLPSLGGISVHPDLRGGGLGAAITARLTREALSRAEVCLLGMFADNDRARRVYHGLGYVTGMRWSSRVLGQR